MADDNKPLSDDEIRERGLPTHWPGPQLAPGEYALYVTRVALNCAKALEGFAHNVYVNEAKEIHPLIGLAECPLVYFDIFPAAKARLQRGDMIDSYEAFIKSPGDVNESGGVITYIPEGDDSREPEVMAYMIPYGHLGAQCRREDRLNDSLN